MKKPIRFLIIFSIICFSFFVACNSKNKRIEKIGNKHLTLSLQFDAAASIKDVDTAISIINKRLINYGIPLKNISINKIDSAINIEVKHADNPERIIHLATSIGRFEFWETYEFKELYPILIRTNEILRDSLFIAENNLIAENSNVLAKNSETASLIEKRKVNLQQKNQEIIKQEPLFAYFIPSIKDDINGNPTLIQGPEIGSCKIIDTAIINNMFSKRYVKSLFPRNLILAWKLNPQEFDSTLIGLIALRSSNQVKEPFLTGEVITDAYQVQSKSGQFEISISMNSQGAKLWKDITFRLSKEQECIAIVIDGLVYSYPMVMNEIPNGHSVLTGNFTKEEAEDIANIIKFHQLPIVIKTIESKITNE